MTTNYELLNLETNRPDVYKNVVEYTHDPNCKFRLFLTMKDGSELIYDDMLDTITKPRHDRNNPEPLSEDDWREEFASRLNYVMQIKRWTQNELSEKTGISQGMIGKYSRGESIPSVHNLTKMAAVMNCSVEELIDFL